MGSNREMPLPAYLLRKLGDRWAEQPERQAADQATNTTHLRALGLVEGCHVVVGLCSHKA